MTKGRPLGRPFFCVRPRWYLARVRHVAASILLLLCGCRKEQPPAPTAEQSAQLNDAENMLNDVAANEEGPADRSTGPSNSSD
jgi:hypothetical protein